MADKITLRRLLRLYALYAKMDFSWLLRDTWACISGILADTVANASTLSGVFLMAERFGGIGGMDTYEVLFMLSFSTISTGLFTMFLSNCNVGHISRVIGRGQLDHKLMQPLPICVQLLTEGFAPISGSGHFWVGIAVCVFSLTRLQITVTAGWLALFVLCQLLSMAVLLGMSYIPAVLAFYAPVACEEISSTMINDTWQLASYPLGVMPAWLRIGLCTLLPVGLNVWFPSLILLRKTDVNAGIMLLVLAASFTTALTVILFKKGLNYYAKTGAQRYTEGGHRK